MAWPAKDLGGKLVAPPAEHVLHELDHTYELDDEELLLSRPKLGDFYVDSELPESNLCGLDARYDTFVEMKGTKGGAYLCSDHYSEHGSGTLALRG